MKIGIDGRLWNETGVGRYIRNLVKYLAEIDKQNQYIVFLRQKEFETVIIPGNNFTKRLADIHWHTFAEQTSFLSILYKENVDLVHFPYFSFPLLYSRPFVITMHDLILFHFPTGKASTLPTFLYDAKLFAYKRLMHHAATHAKKIIAVSQATKNEIIDQLHAKPEKILVTYEGIDTDIIDSTPVEVPRNKQYFLYVGNAYPHKNLDKFLKAFAEFVVKVPQVNLILVGKEDYFYEKLKRKLLTFGIDNSVIILSNISDSQLVFLYRHAIGLVMPSLMEGFGLPTIEAMANNCLVIVSDIPSLKEICQDAAVYFDPNDRQSMVKTLQDVYFNQVALQKNKVIGLERAKLFSWKKMAEETLAVYTSVPSNISFLETAKNFPKKV